MTPLNSIVETSCDAESILHGFLPKPCKLTVGEKGLELVSSAGDIHEQITWDQLSTVVCDIFRGSVRSFELHRADGRVTTLMAAEDIAVLRSMATHLGRENIINANESRHEGAPVARHPLVRMLDALAKRRR